MWFEIIDDEMKISIHNQPITALFLVFRRLFSSRNHLPVSHPDLSNYTLLIVNY